MMNRIRLAVQLLFTIITNGYMYGFLNGKIYRGGLKYVCVPGLNCYSCPGALSSCPVGALQALLNQRGFRVPFSALGFFFLFGSILGRFICGWLCPFGLVQDLLYKIPFFRKKKTLPFHKYLKFGKYAVLLLLVCFGSVFLFGGFAKVPAFCKYLCPSGTLFGAAPLLAMNESLRAQAGGLFYWKLGVLIFIIILSMKWFRPFCQYLCPLGAIYGLFNRFSLVQIHWEKERCISCKACERACPAALSVVEISRSPECIRCGKCVDACPEKCLHFGQMKILGKEKTRNGKVKNSAFAGERNGNDGR
ncbi:MAG: 4Fe-4S binding protein [Lachnospiraceae bacterium]|nr:4Fe-4S binding protein [Lachnospiraceae bacterium]